MFHLQIVALMDRTAVNMFVLVSLWLDEISFVYILGVI